jgi:hypothetical protein
MPLPSDPVFYVYVLFRLDGSPCYVGKGAGDRWLEHEGGRFSRTNRHLNSIIRKARAVGRELPKIKLAEGLTEERAFELERIFIAVIGRQHEGGPLANLTAGGDGISGLVFTDEHRANLSLARMGKPLSEEHKAKTSATMKGRPGRVPSEATCLKISQTKIEKGQKPPPEHMAMLAAMKPHLGHKHSDKTKAVMSEKKKKHFESMSPDDRAMLSTNLSKSITEWWARRKAQPSINPPPP